MAVKDSATIRVITVVTLLFLPAQFIAVRAPKLLTRPPKLIIIIIDSFRDAILLDRLVRDLDGIIIFAVDLLCYSNTVHIGHLRLLEMDGQKAEAKS